MQLKLYKKSHSFLRIVLLCGLALAGPVSALEAFAEEITETKKIEMLISRVEASGGIFVRNGSEHSATAAGAHMRLKYSRAGSLIKTAEQFIEYVATKSSITGRPYLIKFPDGREYKSAVWLRARLAEIEQENAGDNKEECCSISR